MSVIGSIAVNVVMKTGGLVKDATRATSSMTRMKAGAIGLKSVLVSLGGVLAVGKLKQGFLNTAKAMDETGKAARKLGLASTELISLRHAADQTAGAGDKLDMALQRMTRRISEAASDTGEAVSALKELRLSARALERMTPDKAFGKIADAMKRVEGQSDKVRLAFKLFDSEGVALVNTLAVGSLGLAKYTAAAKKIGIAYSEDEVKKVEAMNNALDDLSKHFKGTANKLIIEMAPNVTGGVHELTKFIREMRDFWALTTKAETGRKGGSALAGAPGNISNRDYGGPISNWYGRIAEKAWGDFFRSSRWGTQAGAVGPNDTDPQNLRRLRQFSRGSLSGFGRHEINAFAKRDFARQQTEAFARQQTEAIIKDLIPSAKTAIGAIGKSVATSPFASAITGIAKSASDELTHATRARVGQFRRETDMFRKEQAKQQRTDQIFRGNPLLEATSAEGFRALRQGRTDQIPKEQLSEAKKQTAELRKQTTAIEKMKLIEVGI